MHADFRRLLLVQGSLGWFKPSIPANPDSRKGAKTQRESTPFLFFFAPLRLGARIFFGSGLSGLGIYIIRLALCTLRLELLF
jgi:hypothetical protein